MLLAALLLAAAPTPYRVEDTLSVTYEAQNGGLYRETTTDGHGRKRIARVVRESRRMGVDLAGRAETWWPDGTKQSVWEPQGTLVRYRLWTSDGQPFVTVLMDKSGEVRTIEWHDADAAARLRPCPPSRPRHFGGPNGAEGPGEKGEGLAAWIQTRCGDRPGLEGQSLTWHDDGRLAAEWLLINTFGNDPAAAVLQTALKAKVWDERGQVRATLAGTEAGGLLTCYDAQGRKVEEGVVRHRNTAIPLAAEGTWRRWSAAGELELESPSASATPACVGTVETLIFSTRR